MYLKTLTIRGFKSFASKTTFEFEPGITSVIGPNGSGKSNVVDALAWVMGEQGVKNLRGGKMEDVIFAGTTGRSPLGRAQVELTIDNSDGTLPIDFSEVTISRTLFRAGGSEYHINGEAARLLDIQELLSDSGMGREMHVIVGQGQLDRILQATPEERRGFIEEAAGILKHRRRKERSERKLESMRANLDRIRDLTEEVHRQLGPLSRQASTARKAQRIQHDVRDASARLLADEVVTQQQRLRELVDSDRHLETRQKQLTDELAQAESTAGELTEQLTQTAQAAASARDHRYKLTALAERYRSLHALANERLKTASRPPVASSGLAPEEAEHQLADNVAAHEQSSAKLTQLQTALEAAVEKKAAAEKHARITQETYTQLVREEADQQKSYAVAESRKTSTETQLNSLREQLERLVQEGSHRSDSSAENEAEITKQKSALTEAEAALEEFNTRLEAAQEQAQTARAELREAENALTELQAAHSATQARVEVLADTLRPASGSAQAAIQQLDPQDISALLDIEPGWERAIAALLAGSTDRLWLTSREHGIQAAQLLQHHEVSDVRVFYPHALSQAKELPQIEGAVLAGSVVRPRENAENAYEFFKSLLNSCMLVETLTEASQLLHRFESATQQSNTQIATKQGHVLTSSWLEVRGDGAASSLEQRAVYDRAVEDLDRLSHDVTQAEEARLEASARRDTTRTALQEIQQAVQEAQSTVTTLRERIALHERNLKQQHASEQRNTAQQSKLRAEIEQAQRQYHEAVERFEALSTAVTLAGSTSGGVEDAAAAQQQAERQATEARAAETEARLALRTAENLVQQAHQRVEQARRRLSSAKIAQQEYQRALVRQRKTVQRLRELVAAITVAIEHIDSSVARADHDFAELEQTRAELATRVETAEHATTTCRQELGQVQEQLHERRLVRQEHELKLEQLQERALNELGYSLPYLIEHFGPDQPVDTGDEDAAETVFFDRQEQQKRLRTAKRNLNALGKINPLALEEYAAVQERHEYLTQQLADLEASRRDLLRIIEDVNATVLEVFTAAYEDTAAQFEHVFATLFPGGEGKLSLTEPDNMLETGIEVEARPAGKKVKRLSLLSGGERSLSAIALLVSIFKARPSPFYVMDEVEAALDDTNLTRLLTILKELQEDSQLIIITHQKRTMEISDALYGVSMRGDGVSQVISQKLDHV